MLSKQIESCLIVNEEENKYVAEWGTAKDFMHFWRTQVNSICHTSFPFSSPWNRWQNTYTMSYISVNTVKFILQTDIQLKYWAVWFNSQIIWWTHGFQIIGAKVNLNVIPNNPYLSVLKWSDLSYKTIFKMTCQRVR